MLLRIAISILLPIAIVAIFVVLGPNDIAELLLSWPMRVLGALQLVDLDESFYDKWADASAVLALATECAFMFAAFTFFARLKVARQFRRQSS
jgi:hypothetical protein